TKVSEDVTNLRENGTFEKEGEIWNIDYIYDGIKNIYRPEVKSLGTGVTNVFKPKDTLSSSFLYVKNGETWYKPYDSEAVLLCQTECTECAGVNDLNRGPFYFKDTQKNLWEVVAVYNGMGGNTARATKKAVDVADFDEYGCYLDVNAVLYNEKGEKVTDNVESFVFVKSSGIDCIWPIQNRVAYSLKKDNNQTVYKGSSPILDHVVKIESRSDNYSTGVYMTRTDGSIWVSDLSGNPAPRKLSDYKNDIQVTGIKLSPTETTMTEGGIVTLKATIEPENATNKNLAFASSNKAVATVDAKGVVNAVAPGTTKITVTTEDGNKTVACSVTVEKAVAKLDPETKEIKGIPVGESSEALIANLKENNTIGVNDQVQVLSAKGETIAADAPLATGMKVRITAGAKAKAFSLSKAEEASTKAGVKEYTVIVKGDINGDGKVSAQDIRSTQNHILSKTELSDCYLKAADTNADSKVSAQDIRTVQNHILGKQSIVQ
ncbi:MAG: Ig-like domain-containing protein, partial [Eubacterium sp.]